MRHEGDQARSRKPQAQSPADRLNTVGITAAQFGAAWEASAIASAAGGNGMAAARARSDAAAETLDVNPANSSEGLRAAALQARVTALADWIETHDPAHQSESAALREAAARHLLSASDSGIGFEASGFQELVLFLEELPW